MGLAGSGKTSLAERIERDCLARGRTCAIVDAEAMRFTFKGSSAAAADHWRRIDVLILEHYPGFFDGGRSGDTLIRISTVTTTPADAATQGA